MISYQDYRCPVCGEKFTEQDDIVVCPDCGAPHHRACWKTETKCWYHARHQDGDVWREELRVAPAGASAASARSVDDANPSEPENAPPKDLRYCPRCGTPHPMSAHYCQNCSHPLQPNTPPTDGQPGPNMNGAPFPPFGYVVNPFLNATPSSDIEGIPVQEVSDFVGKNPIYYVPQFDRIQQIGRGRFHFSAFLFHGIWMLFRKQYKRGAIVLAIVFAFTLLSAIIEFRFTLPIAEALLTSAGFDLSSGVISSITTEQQMGMFQAMSQLSTRDTLLLFLPTLIDAALLIFQIVIGFKANKWYYRHCLQRIRAIKETHPSQETLREELSSRGGVNTPLMFSMLVCALLISQYLDQIVYLFFR